METVPMETVPMQTGGTDRRTHSSVTPSERDGQKAPARSENTTEKSGALHSGKEKKRIAESKAKVKSGTKVKESPSVTAAKRTVHCKCG